MDYLIPELIYKDAYIIIGLIGVIAGIFLYFEIQEYKKKFKDAKAIINRMKHNGSCFAEVVKIHEKHYSVSDIAAVPINPVIVLYNDSLNLIDIDVSFYNGTEHEVRMIPYEITLKHLSIQKGDNIKIYYDDKSKFALPEHMVKPFLSKYKSKIAIPAVVVFISFSYLIFEVIMRIITMF